MGGDETCDFLWHDDTWVEMKLDCYYIRHTRIPKLYILQLYSKNHVRARRYTVPAPAQIAVVPPSIAITNPVVQGASRTR